MADVTIPRAYLDNYAAGIQSIDEYGRRALADALGRADLENRKQVTAIMRVHTNTTSQAAATLASQFYRGMSILQTGEDVEVAPISGWDQTATDVATNAIISEAGGDPVKLLRGLLNRESYETNRASKYGVWANGKRDKRGTRYARVPSGKETCAWCLMTAGLGFWYMTEEAASHSHAHCDCIIVPGIAFTNVVIDGYDSDLLRDMWREARRKLEEGELDPELLEYIRNEELKAIERGDDSWRLDTNGVLIVMRRLYDLT